MSDAAARRFRAPTLREVIAHPITQVALLGATFLAARTVLTQWPGHQSWPAYTGAVLFVPALSVPKAVIALLLTFGVSAALVLRKLSWRDEELRPLRVLVFGVALIMTWAYAFYPYNHFLGHAHLVDRLLLVALTIGVWRHPAFFPPLVWLLAVIIDQFSQPIGYSWTDIDLVLDACCLIAAALALRSLGIARAQGIFYGFLVLLGAHYFDAARFKNARSPTLFGWAFDNNIANLFVSSHLNGWLPDLSEPTVLAIAGFISAVAVVLQVFTLINEASPAVMLLSRRLTIVVLLSLIAFHIGILASSGIFFWKWVILDALLAVTLFRHGREWMKRRWLVLVFAPLVIWGGEWSGIANHLAWWDTRLSQYHEMWVTTSDGHRYRLDEHDLAPYDKSVAQDRFFFSLHNEAALTGTLGAAKGGYRQFRQIQDMKDERKLLKLIDTQGRHTGNEKRAQQIEKFLRTFLRSRNAHANDALVRFFALVSPPMHIGHRAPSADRLPLDAKVERLEVVYREVWYDGTQLRVLRDRVVRTIDIDVKKGERDDDAKSDDVKSDDADDVKDDVDDASDVK